jgi:catechol 2,3-dioxygenase-like lactoylglutathione lyase family enzyme
MEQRVSLITLGVSDLDRARAFYDGLGWSRSVKDAQGIVFYQVGGMALSLYPRSELAKDSGMADDGGGFTGMALAYNARTRAEVDSVLAEAEAAGAVILKAAADTFWGGYAGYFSDPDGFAWEVAWNPHFPLTEEGALVLPD